MASLSTPFLASPGAAGALQVARRERRMRSGVIRCEADKRWREGPADLVKLLGRNVWGRGLPPGALVAVVKEVWTAGWLTMMAQLAPPTEERAYDRPSSQFRGRAPPAAALGQLHLYVAAACPWAHRAAIVHSLKGFGDAVPLAVAVPGATGLWELGPQRRLMDVYKSQSGGYDGRATVPMLWDASKNRVVNNESSDIIEILNGELNHLAGNPRLDLAPTRLRGAMDAWNELVYTSINNGVYRCGFAQSQEAYDAAAESLFRALDQVDEHLAASRYLCGDELTLADVRLFTTLLRFDPVYHILFKCSKQTLAEYAHLHAYMRDVYQIPGVAATCDMDAIMHGYYKVLFPLNPGGISPALPRAAQVESLLQPHDRHLVSSHAALP